MIVRSHEMMHLFILYENQKTYNIVTCRILFNIPIIMLLYYIIHEKVCAVFNGGFIPDGKVPSFSSIREKDNNESE